MPAFLFCQALLTRRHDPGYSFGDLPEYFSIGHRRHAFFVREIGRLSSEAWEVRFIAGTGFTVTENAVPFRSLEVKLLAFGNGFFRRGNWILSLVGISRQLPG